MLTALGICRVSILVIANRVEAFFALSFLFQLCGHGKNQRTPEHYGANVWHERRI